MTAVLAFARASACRICALARFPINCVRLRSISNALWVLDYELHQ